jgi:hypothetical protein
MGRHVASVGEMRCAYRILVGKQKGKRPLGRPSRRWEDNIKIDFRVRRVENNSQLKCPNSARVRAAV